MNVKKMYSVAFNLYEEFMKENILFENGQKVYYKIYFENDKITAEEIYFFKKWPSFYEFKHKSEYRKNHSISLYSNLTSEEYESNTVVINEKQFVELNRAFEISIRS